MFSLFQYLIGRGTHRILTPDLYYIFQAWQKHIVWKTKRNKGSKEDIEITLPISNSSTEEQRTNISTLLQYIVEGIVPLLSTFCVEYQELFNDQLSLLPEHMTILNQVGTAVAVSIIYN